MSKLRVHLTFPEDKILEPVVYEVGQKYKVVTNIRRADVREKTGWMELELSGESSEIEGAVAYLKTRQVKVDPVEKNVIE